MERKKKRSFASWTAREEKGRKAATETRNRARGKAPAGWAVGKLGGVGFAILERVVRITYLVHWIHYSWIVAEMV